MALYIAAMADFASAAFQASLALGGPHRLARSLGVPPDALFRWIAGVDLPGAREQRELKQRIGFALQIAPAPRAAARRHTDFAF